jgi:hypothetical protein
VAILPTITALLALPVMLYGAASPWCSNIRPNSVFFVGIPTESDPSNDSYWTDDTGGKAHYFQTTFHVTEAFAGTKTGDILRVLTIRKYPANSGVFVESYRDPLGMIAEECNCGQMVVVENPASTESFLAYLRGIRSGPGNEASLRLYSVALGDSDRVTATIYGPVTRFGSAYGQEPVVFDDTPPGRYAIAVGRMGYAMTYPPFTVEIPPNSCPQVFVQLRSDRAVSGVVATADGSPVAGARVAIRSVMPQKIDYSNSVIADSAGRYKLEHVPIGRYEAIASVPDKSPNWANATRFRAAADEDTQLDLPPH